MKKWLLFLIFVTILVSGCSGKKPVQYSPIMTKEEIAAFRETHEQIDITFLLVDLIERPVEYYLEQGCSYALLEFVEELPAEVDSLEPGNEGEKVLAEKAGIPAYSISRKQFRFRYMRTIVEGRKENAITGFENWEIEDFMQENGEIMTYIAPAWNALDFVPGEQYLFLITPFKSEEKLELITSYSYYVTEDSNIVAAIYDVNNVSEQYTGYRLSDFEKLVEDKMKMYDETEAVQ